MNKHIITEGNVVFHVPHGKTRIVILEAPTAAHARKVARSLLSSGVDWSQQHTAVTHSSMRAAIVAATSDGHVSITDF